MKGKDFRARITSKNQLTLPAGVSALLHVGPGDDVGFTVTDDGVLIVPLPVRERLAPLVGHLRRGEGKTREQIDAEVRALRGPRDPVTALDTDVLIDIEEGTPEVAEMALRAIERAGERNPVVVCGIVYAELCARRSLDAAGIAATLAAARIAIDVAMPIEVWRDAGMAYAAYQQRRIKSGGGTSRRIVADFIIGAHARCAGTLVTSDADFYRRAFPDLRVIDVRSP